MRLIQEQLKKEKRLVDMIMAEKIERDENEEALLEMLKPMINAMKTQLVNER